MKKIISIILLISLLFSYVGCSNKMNNNEEDHKKVEYLVGSKLSQTENGRNYLTVQDKPFLYTGAQLRLDGYTQLDKMSLMEMEEQFRMAQELGVKCVEIPISWNEIEPEENKYNFRKFKTYLEWCLKYNLKMELLWFAYNTGLTLEMYVPSYILDDKERFPRYKSNIDDQVWGEQGRVTQIVRSTESLLEREREAIKQLTDFIFEWELSNNNPNVVITYQVHNEADNFPRWNVGSHEVCKQNGEPLSYQEAWEDVRTAMNSAGKAFKNSKYKAVTRANLVTLRVAYDYDDFVPKVFNLEGIDIVGDDTYTSSVYEQNASLERLSSGETLSKNLAHVSENSGSFKNTSSLILSAVTSGYGYLIYCLSLPMFWIKNETNWDWWEQGIYDVEWNKKEHTDGVANVLSGLNKASEILASCELKDMASFNTQSDNPETTFSQEYKFRNIKFSLSTQEGALGYAFYLDEAIYVYANNSLTISLDNVSCKGLSYGKFVGQRFVTEQTESNMANEINLRGNNLYKIEII